jgi:hypothetical protein
MLGQITTLRERYRARTCEDKQKNEEILVNIRSRLFA